MSASDSHDRNPARSDRRHKDSPEDNRNPYQRDRDRILYTSAFRRLAEVTQVVSSAEGHVFHNRLTHSLEVAQVGRRLAEKLGREQPQIAKDLGEIDPDVTEAAALAHDLGHPPFGHIAEDELDQLLVEQGIAEGFNGNAQSFRIVNHLALRRDSHPGLNLTRATLNAILKYPYTRSTGGEEQTKWGSYHSEKDVLEWARQVFPKGDRRRSAEAELMDWADDIVYAVHDVEDMYRAGLIPLDRLLKDESERGRFYAYAQSKCKPGEWASRESAFEQLIVISPLYEPYSSTRRLRGVLRSFTAGLIARYIGAIELRVPTSDHETRVSVAKEYVDEVWMWKQLTWYYVIERPGLATQQLGLRAVIRTLFEIYCVAAEPNEKKKTNLGIFPPGFREAIEQARDDSGEIRRYIVDLIASLTERQAIDTFRRLTGVSSGSVLDYIVR